MKRIISRIAVGVSIAGVSALALGVAAYYAGARVNTTKSIPVGLYWTVDSPVEKGAYVTVCPPQLTVFQEAKARDYIGAGFCPGGYGLMMKKILAAKDDEIRISDEGVLVNGQLLPLSKLISTDPAGRLLPRFQADQYTLTNEQLLLMSDVSATSFDGRYYGPVNRSQIQGVIRPIFTW